MRVVNVVMTCAPRSSLFSHPHVATLNKAVQFFGSEWTAVYFPKTGRVKLFSRSLTPPDAVQDCRIDLIVAVAQTKPRGEEEAAEAFRALGLAVDRLDRSPALLVYGRGFTLRVFHTGKAVVFARNVEALKEAERVLSSLT